MDRFDFDLDNTYDGPGEEAIPPAAVVIHTDRSGTRRAVDAEQMPDQTTYRETSARRSK